MLGLVILEGCLCGLEVRGKIFADLIKDFLIGLAELVFRVFEGEWMVWVFGGKSLDCGPDDSLISLVGCLVGLLHEFVVKVISLFPYPGS